MPTTTAPAEPASPPPWDWIIFVAVAIVVLVVLTVVLYFGIKRALAVRKARLLRAETRKKNAAYWDRLIAKETGLSDRLLAYEDDLALALELPIMRNLAEPTTRKAVDSMARAEGYRTLHPTDPDQNPIDSEYGKAVAQFERDLTAAETYARKIGQTHYNDEEREKAQKAMAFLKTALDLKGSPNERQMAYKRVLRIMEELSIPVTPRALAQIEMKVGRLELTRLPHAEAEHTLAADILAQRKTLVLDKAGEEGASTVPDRTSKAPTRRRWAPPTRVTTWAEARKKAGSSR